MHHLLEQSKLCACAWVNKNDQHACFMHTFVTWYGVTFPLIKEVIFVRINVNISQLANVFAQGFSKFVVLMIIGL